MKKHSRRPLGRQTSQAAMQPRYALCVFRVSSACRPRVLRVSSACLPCVFPCRNIHKGALFHYKYVYGGMRAVAPRIVQKCRKRWKRKRRVTWTPRAARIFLVYRYGGSGCLWYYKERTEKYATATKNTQMRGYALKSDTGRRKQVGEGKKVR